MYICIYTHEQNHLCGSKYALVNEDKLFCTQDNAIELYCRYL